MEYLPLAQGTSRGVVSNTLAGSSGIGPFTTIIGHTVWFFFRQIHPLEPEMKMRPQPLPGRVFPVDHPPLAQVLVPVAVPLHHHREDGACFYGAFESHVARRIHLGAGGQIAFPRPPRRDSGRARVRGCLMRAAGENGGDSCRFINHLFAAGQGKSCLKQSCKL